VTDKDHLNIRVAGWTILKYILKNRIGECGMDFIAWDKNKRRESLNAVNEPSRPKRCAEFLDYLRHNVLLRQLLSIKLLSHLDSK
jgi:hypothetical protein